MPHYAILGATGSTGSAILRYLHSRPDQKTNINLYARSESKLLTLHPYIRTSTNIKIFTGALSDSELLKSCLKSTTAIFCTVAQNINEPNCSIAQQTAHAVVTALDSLRREAETSPSSASSFTCPQVIFLSSATLNPIFLNQIPSFSQPFLKRAMYHVYLDLELAIKYIESQVWIPLTCAEPGALVQDVSRGWELSETEITGLISYDDLGRGMVQMAEEEEEVDEKGGDVGVGGVREDGDRNENGNIDGRQRSNKKKKKWIGKKVGIKATGYVRPYIWPLIKFELGGILAYFLPSVWKMGRGYLWD